MNAVNRLDATYRGNRATVHFFSGFLRDVAGIQHPVERDDILQQVLF
jgi:hypothetical protein